MVHDPSRLKGKFEDVSTESLFTDFSVLLVSVYILTRLVSRFGSGCTIPRSFEWCNALLTTRALFNKKSGRAILALGLFTIFTNISAAPPTGVGQRVVTNGTVNVRASAGSTTVLGQQSSGKFGTTINGPTYASLGGTLYKWFNVNFDSGVDGWVADIGLDLVTMVAPSLTSPSNYATGVSLTPTLQWSGGTATYWEVNISAGGTIVHTSPALSSSQHSYTVPSGALQAGVQYKWDVSACPTTSCTSGYATSSNRYFTTDNPMVAPTLTSPADYATGVSLTPALQWSGGTATYWEVNISAGGTIVHTSAALSSSQYSYTVPSGALQAGVQYKWDVTACPTAACNDASTYKVSGNRYFTTAAAMVAPSLTSPANYATGVSQTPLLQWSGGTGTYWEVNIREVGSSIVHTSPALSSSNMSYTVPSGTLQAGVQYKWDVTACPTAACNDASTYKVSANRYFTTAGGSTTSPYIYTISPIAMPASTALQLLTVTGEKFTPGVSGGGKLVFTDPSGDLYYTTSHPTRIVSVTSTEWQYNINNFADVGIWKVQVINADGQPSNQVSFDVVPQAPGLSIQGRVRIDGEGSEGVNLALTGTASSQITSGASGAYIFPALANGQYIVTPAYQNLQFSPPSKSIVLDGSSKGNIDFRGCDPSVSLTIELVNANDQPVAGASVSAGGVQAIEVTGGRYQVSGLGCSSGTIVAEALGNTKSMPFDRFDRSTYVIELQTESAGYGSSGDSGVIGDPVNTATGNYFYQRRDLEIPGIGMPFRFERTYNSRKAADTNETGFPLGFGWSHNLDVRLQENPPGTFTITWGDGHTETWITDGVGGFIPEIGIFDTLIYEGGGLYTLEKRNRTQYRFDINGQLASIEDKNGNIQTLNYTGSLLTSITDTVGRSIALSYDGSNRLTQLIDPIGRTIDFIFDANGDLVSATDPVGNITTFTYDVDHQLLTLVDPMGTTIVSNIYDGADRLVSHQSDAKGNDTWFEYDSVGGITTITDALGNDTIHYHDSFHRLIKEVDANGAATEYEYDSLGNRTKVTDKNGNLTQYGYDARGNVTSKSDALGNVTVITYDDEDNPLSRTDALGNITQFTYDANGNLLTTTDALGYTTVVTYDPSGLPLTVTDPLGNVTTNAYDTDGNLEQVTDALGNITEYTYDVIARKLSESDPLGRTTQYDYDDNDNLLTITDALGNTVTHSYDANNNRLNTTDQNGNLTQYGYDEKNLKISTTDGLGNVTGYSYDALDRQKAMTDAKGRITQYLYDAVGNQVEMIDALGNSEITTFDAQGNKLSATDPNGNTTTYAYDALNRRTRVTDALGQATVTEYDALGRIVSITDAKGQVSTRSYDALGRVIQTTDTLGDTRTHGYDANGNRLSTTDALGNTTQFEYDALNRQIRTTDALGNQTLTTYDAAGQVVSVTDANGNTTTTGYDLLGRVVTRTDPLGNSMQYGYDNKGNRLTTTDALGHVTTSIYDALDRVISTQDALGSATDFTYDEVGNRIGRTDSKGNVTQYGYDPLNRIQQMTDALGQITQYGYDANGNRVSTTDPLGHVSGGSYDALDRLVSETDALGNSSSRTYDPLGNLLTLTDANGEVTAFEYDPMNRLTGVTDANGGVVLYTYDGNGNRLSMTDPNGNTTNYAYDALNRKITTTEPLGHMTSQTYDGVGNRISRTDAKSNTTNYAYDALNRLISIAYPDASAVALAYDAKGRRIQLQDSLGTTQHVYDALDRRISTTDPFGKQVQYGYDANGNRTSLIYPGNKTVSYGYDALNRLQSVTDWLSNTTAYSYDAASRLTQIMNANGTKASYGYDNADRMTSLVNQKSDLNLISSYSFTLDPVGNHSTEERNEPQLPNFTSGQQANLYDAENRLAETNSVANSFDENGNLTAKGANSYGYDYENRLTQTNIASGNTSYQYDGRGNRYSRTRDGTTTRFVLDTNTTLTNVLAETDNSGTVQAYNVYGHGLISRIQPDESATYFHYDSRGSTVAITDATETLTGQYAYDPFGRVIASNGANNPFRYLGRHGVLDEGDDLNYIRARYYDSGQQRFINKDLILGDIRDSQTLNRYIIALNNPVINIDPSGLYSWKTAGVGILQLTAAVGGVASATLVTLGAAYGGPVTGPAGIASAISITNDSAKHLRAAWDNITSGQDEWVTKDDFETSLDKVLDKYPSVALIEDTAALIGFFNVLKTPDKITDGARYISKLGKSGDIGQMANFQLWNSVRKVIDVASMPLREKNIFEDIYNDSERLVQQLMASKKNNAHGNNDGESIPLNQDNHPSIPEQQEAKGNAPVGYLQKREYR